MSKQQDEFKMIPNSTYRLYKNGLLFNEKTLKYKKWHISNNGYIRCQIHIKNVPKMISQHRVLAELFIQNSLTSFEFLNFALFKIILNKCTLFSLIAMK